ncbi:MAG: polysaccharide deacetylase family protein, partial [Candidatus Nanoarchaeia archaeon]
MKLIEVIFFIIVLMVVVVTVGKYYYPSQLVSAAGEAGQDTAKTYDFLKYKSEILWFEDKYNHTPSQERARSIPVLAYHGLAKQDYKSDVLVENFKKQMFMMKREGYQTITLEEFYEYRLGKRELPEKSFLLTFDDGIKSSYYGADPVLKALDYTAVMFLISKYSLGESDHPYYLSKSEVKKMLKTGRWEVQAHARDAHSLVQIDKAGAKANFFGNKMWLADEDRIETEEEYTARVSREFVNVRKDIE